MTKKVVNALESKNQRLPYKGQVVKQAVQVT
jgi:hypothetical protein